MQIKLKPWSGNERLYFYRQSQQLARQTGQIGKLRADFDRDGSDFFSSWEDIREHLKTDGFRQTFDDVINSLRSSDGETPFASRKALNSAFRLIDFSAGRRIKAEYKRNKSGRYIQPRQATGGVVF